jgi:glycine/D-amino acid oxidase-like deaminating enzyme
MTSQANNGAAAPVHIETDVLVIGAGGAGMYAALEAARAGAAVVLADRSLIGRGGATVMAQMTVAAALAEQTPDHWEHHLADTLAAGRGLCDERLAALLCEDGPHRLREMDGWKVGWAREDGHIKQAQAPGHDRPRCAYVDFLSTGPAVSRTLRAQLIAANGIRRIGELVIVDIALRDGVACGATALHLPTGEAVTLAAKAVVIATGGLTGLYRRNSASANMGGDGYALALRAGAELIDMEFVQFFPIGHLAPRLVGMDPIMWDPFRYKLGGKLLNAEMREFEQDYATQDTRSDGRYVLTRDLATYAITREVEAAAAALPAALISVSSTCPRPRYAAPSAPSWTGSPPMASIFPGARSKSRRSRITIWAACASTRRCEPQCPAFTPAARRWAALAAPTASRATPSPKRWCSARVPAATPRGMRRKARRPGRRRQPAPRSICCAAPGGATRPTRRQR